MATIARVDVLARGFSGFPEPQHPSGYYRVDGVMIGDASGGDSVLAFDFALSSSLRNSQFYSLEDVRLTSFQSNSGTLEMAVVNLDSPVTSRFALEMKATLAGFTSLLTDQLEGIRGLFLGRQDTPSANASVTFTINNTDTILTRVMIAGYIWGARSANLSGGPQRPPTGVYRP